MSDIKIVKGSQWAYIIPMSGKAVRWLKRNIKANANQADYRVNLELVDEMEAIFLKRKLLVDVVTTQDVDDDLG